jgi:hypothetical protein
VRLAQIASRALVLDYAGARPEEVDESPASAKLFYRFFKGCQRPAFFPKDFEKFIPEGLAF